MNSRTTPAEQDYLKAIYELGALGPVTTMSLAVRLRVAPASVTHMLQKLAAAQPPWVEYSKRQGVTLTEAGSQAALRVLRRHRLLETFLAQVMGYPLDEIHPEAEHLEHVISEQFEARLAALLGHPDYDPHGDPIPASDLRLPVRSLRQLTQLPAGQNGLVRRVHTSDARALRRFEELRLIPGAALEVLDNTPLDGVVQLRLLPDGAPIALGGPLAELVWVEQI